MSQLVDIVLNPYVKQTKSYIKNTTDFIKKLQCISDITDEDWIFTMDVTSLYTNILISEGLTVVRELIQERESPLPNDRVIQILQFVLENNNFQFDGANYLQVDGTAMGTRVAPTFANLFMSDFENRHIYNCKLKKPRVWFRFIDDIWGIFRGTESELLNFSSYCNEIHSSIKFTMEYSKSKVTFLDVITYREQNLILTNLYEKPTNTHSYLNYDSCHPVSTKNAIPYSQFLRVRRNCSKWLDFVSNALKFYLYFQLRGYPHSVLKDSLLKVNKLTRSACLYDQEATTSIETTKKFFLITEHNPSLPNLRSWLKELWKLTDRSSSTRPLVNSTIIFGNTRPKNIQEMITKADISLKSKIKRVPPRCHRLLKCRHCPKICKKGKITSTSTSRTYKIPHRITCNSTNVIYCIECEECHKQYVGQTRNKFLIRVNQHLNDIQHNRDTPVARHFNNIHKADTILYILQLIKKDKVRERNKWENYWIS